MSGPPTDNTKDRDSQSHDQLTDIADIGRARQQWLNDLGIYTFSELAESSAEDLATQLQAAEHSIKLAMIQQWIEQARRLAQDQDNSRQEQNRDPFTDLEGINTASQQWLYSLEICTFADLAESSAEEVEARLREAGHTVTVNEIQDWIDQSKELVPEPAEVHAPDIAEQETEEETEEDSNALDSASPLTDSLGSTSSTDEPALHSSEVSPPEISQDTDWHSLISFVVTYQTRQVASQPEARIQVQQTETDIQQTWPLGDIERLPAWILARIDDTALPGSAPETTVTEQEVEQEVDMPTPVQIEQVRFLQPPHIEYGAQAGQPTKMIGPIQSSRPFLSEVSLSFNVEALEDLEESLHLQLQAFIANRITGDNFSITSSHTVLCKDVQSTVKVDLPETVLEMGIYRFQLIVNFADTVGTSDLFEIPALQVI
ncbi:hypothetical protein N836_18215 [Leptolyngbya sp. Heron Island J]|uniref:DUF4332 domain-containing protein n=1 Tax=Leptolyngbya sp. Heron Island J TaxID=1385935 RepID=UPI0003B9A033|nr:DUF4332 domain-containing protein [Leptolyngbya sp. Heron Island J]ESA34183.1 hypothetical protein N836_18215 [Leptolyngbya sp. Heron Island J]